MKEEITKEMRNPLGGYVCEPVHYTIKEMSEDDKPREKMIAYGAEALSTSELMAILIGSGTPKLTAVELSRQILKAYNDDLSVFCKIDVEELTRNPNFKGIGEAKACKIKAAMELGKRMREESRDFPRGHSPAAVAAYLQKEMKYFNQEHFVVLLLDVKMNIFKKEMVSKGTINATLVSPREVFAPAIRQYAAAVILAHNHPSGDPTPSEADLELTKHMIHAGKILGIQVIDHVIVGPQDYLSMRSEDLCDFDG